MTEELVLHRGLSKSKCRSCKAPVVWAFTQGGSKAPYEVDANGLYVMENGVAVHVGPPKQQLELGEKPDERVQHTSHFARCENAASWRKR